ncbi:MAG: bifunctional phosphoribosylaminoimidazolecarboxamide formyltransferase/IMP cyclohydrolase [Candidatus Omnitrophica bacterium]|nr:bifunctional phosphoribosylaminoimidazolecarboxamide formyltransferase/IMP cyclohydrolase [Candidatus Omnitrophota bacterium]
MLKIKRAILSVSDKSGIAELAQGLGKYGVEIISTGGTLALLKSKKIAAVPISSFTHFPEILEGRLKTLHPKIHGGLLYRREKKSQVREASRNGILPIDLVAVNLYPFEEATRTGKLKLEAAVEEIDIGGPTMLRSAAKNFKSVAVLCDPADYASFLEELARNRGRISEDTLYRLACKVFQNTARYDSIIAGYLGARRKAAGFPEKLTLPYKKAADLRYGENPHQKAALYHGGIGGGQAYSFRQLHGKELSYNNLLDIESAQDTVEEFGEPAAAVIKHNTPCGVAVAEALADAAGAAIDCDLEASFGGIVGLNQPCDAATAGVILEKLGFLEVITAPSFSPEALGELRKRKNLRLIVVQKERETPAAYRFSKLGLLVQDADRPLRGEWNSFRKKIQPVTRLKPTAAELKELFFAWRCVKVVKSNGIVLTKDGRTVGIGAGQVSRVDSVRIACQKAGDRARGSFLASDAFFPMPDNIEVAAAAGIRAIVQPGGSIRDREVVEAADRMGLAMIFTGERHFRH